MRPTARSNFLVTLVGTVSAAHAPLVIEASRIHRGLVQGSVVDDADGPLVLVVVVVEAACVVVVTSGMSDRTRTKTCSSKSCAPGGARFDAWLWNTTKRPPADMLPPLPPRLASAPAEVTLTRVVVAV